MDDDVQLRTMLGLMLTGEGHQVSHAMSSQQAIASHLQLPFDLVITDLGLGGFEVLMELRRHSSPAKLIATFKTSWLAADLCRRMCEQLGAHCVLIKPFAPEQLLAAVRSALS